MISWNFFSKYFRYYTIFTIYYLYTFTIYTSDIIQYLFQFFSNSDSELSDKIGYKNNWW